MSCRGPWPSREAIGGGRRGGIVTEALRRDPPATVLAVDGGNSKTDVALLDRTGRLLAAVRGPTSSHQAIGLEPGLRVLEGLVGEAAQRAGLPPDARPMAGQG